MVKISAIALILALSSPLSAKAQIDKSEILLTVTGTGVIEQKPSLISSVCTISKYAETEDSARSQLAVQVAKLRVKAASVDGVSFDFSSPVILSPSDSDLAIYAAEAAVEGAADAAARAADAAAALADAAVAAAAAADTAVAVTDDVVETEVAEENNYAVVSQKIGFSATTGEAFLLVRSATAEAGCEEDYRMVRNPVVTAPNTDAAKQAAMQAALSDAEQKAINYAAAMNMRVAAIVEVADVNEIRAFIGDDIAEAFLSEMKRDILRDKRGELANNFNVTTTHVLSVKYQLSPK
ncbi:hypothetical protein ACFOWX_06115 [Sphingorhabdus arenilitoris]|uniref:DUF541 domain-containing protein n=1 Tax=Sphingorhabdus arenilitoris TaxID=1490041 RepID=A0ABV8RF67_9SPHN